MKSLLKGPLKKILETNSITKTSKIKLLYASDLDPRDLRFFVDKPWIEKPLNYYFRDKGKKRLGNYLRTEMERLVGLEGTFVRESKIFSIRLSAFISVLSEISDDVNNNYYALLSFRVLMNDERLKAKLLDMENPKDLDLESIESILTEEIHTLNKFQYNPNNGNAEILERIIVDHLSGRIVEFLQTIPGGNSHTWTEFCGKACQASVSLSELMSCKLCDFDSLRKILKLEFFPNLMDLYQAIMDLENSSVNEKISSVNLAVLGLINP